MINAKEVELIDYKKLRIADMVVCGGCGPSATITRLVTAGWRRMFDRSVSVHTGIICRFGGQFFIAEMLGKGLTISPPSRYEGKKRRYIIGIRRHSVYDEVRLRRNLNQKIAHLYRNSMEYDWKGLLEFVDDKVQDNPKRCYCSELVYQLTNKSVEYPKNYEEMVSPFDLQHTPGWAWPNVWC